MAAFFCITGLIQHVHCVTYELTATPDKVAVGQSLTITAEINNLIIPVGTIQISFDKPDGRAYTIFDNRVTGCRLMSTTTYVNTGKIDLCDNISYKYSITFPSVNSDHIGSYQISAPLQNPYESSVVNVQLLGKWDHETASCRLIQMSDHRGLQWLSISADVTPLL
jgi:hypothetical protein